jgi:hypothetical protein
MIGIASYERSFAINFFTESDTTSFEEGFKSRVIADRSRIRLRTELAGRSAAIVGNAVVQNVGADIDMHDEVIRLNTMRAWQKAEYEDGCRITMWAGHPAFVISRNVHQDLIAIKFFEEAVLANIPLWALSPFHITCDSFSWMRDHGALERLAVAPPPYEIYEVACRTWPDEEVSRLFSIPAKRGTLIGLPYFDLLFTGTRLALLLELCGVKQISLYGSDLFRGTPRDQIWFGHDPALDRDVLQGLERRLSAAGGYLRWHGG